MGGHLAKLFFIHLFHGYHMLQMIFNDHQ